MAVTWGAYQVSGSGQKTRLGIDLWYEGDPNSGSVTVQSRWYREAVYAIGDSSCTLNRAGDLGSSSVEFSWTTTGAAEIPGSAQSSSVSTAYGSVTTVAVNGSITGVYNGLVPTHSRSIDIPARAYLLPKPPASPAVTRNSDTSHTVTWVGDYTSGSGAQPWSNVYVERWDNITGSYYLVATLSWSATSYTDTSTSANREYRYRLRSKNSTGYSTYVYTDYISTTPAAHTNLTWTKQGADIVLAWTKNASMDVTTEVQESADGGTWTAVAAAVSGNTWTHVAPSPSVTHQYRVRPNNGIVGEWTTSTVIQLLAAPLAPTGLTPDGATVDGLTDAVTLAWQHNAVDGTAQTAYELKYQINGGTVVNPGKVTSTSSEKTLAAGTLGHGTATNWQVRTWGSHADPSPWSDVAYVYSGGRPSVTINSPGEIVASSALTIAWTYYDPESTAQAGAVVQLLDATDAPLHAASVTGAVASYAVPVPLANLTNYSVTVTVTDGSGLTGTATHDFSTDFTPPPEPLVTLAWDPDAGTVDVTIDNSGAIVPPGSVEPVFNRLFRSVNGAPWELVADNLPLDTTVTDWTPVTKGSNTYRVETVSVTPTSAFTVTEPLVVSSPWLFVNGGAAFATVARLKGGPSVKLSAGREKVLHQFVGRRSPLEFVGEARPRSFQISGNVDGHGHTSMGSWEAWEAIADLPAPLMYRDPMGRRVNVSIGEVGVVHEAPSKYAKVSATVTEVDA